MKPDDRINKNIIIDNDVLELFREFQKDSVEWCGIIGDNGKPLHIKRGQEKHCKHELDNITFHTHPIEPDPKMLPFCNDVPSAEDITQFLTDETRVELVATKYGFFMFQKPDNFDFKDHIKTIYAERIKDQLEEPERELIDIVNSVLDSDNINLGEEVEHNEISEKEAINDWLQLIPYYFDNGISFTFFPVNTKKLKIEKDEK